MTTWINAEIPIKHSLGPANISFQEANVKQRRREAQSSREAIPDQLCLSRFDRCVPTCTDTRVAGTRAL